MKALEFDTFPSICEQDAVYWPLGDQGIFRCEAYETLKSENFSNFKLEWAGDQCLPLNNDLRVMQFYDFVSLKNDSNMMIGGTQDTGTILFEGKPTWRMFANLKGDGLFSLIDPTNDQIMYAQHHSLANPDAPTMRTEDGGQNWVHAANNTDLPEGNGYDRAFITHDPDQSDVLLTVGDYVYYTDDGGKKWKGMGPKKPNF